MTVQIHNLVNRSIKNNNGENVMVVKFLAIQLNQIN